MGALIASQTAAQSASLWDGVVLSGARMCLMLCHLAPAVSWVFHQCYVFFLCVVPAMKPGPEVASPTLIAITKFLARTLPKVRGGQQAQRAHIVLYLTCSLAHQHPLRCQ